MSWHSAGRLRIAGWRLQRPRQTFPLLSSPSLLQSSVAPLCTALPAGNQPTGFRASMQSAGRSLM